MARRHKSGGRTGAFRFGVIATALASVTAMGLANGGGAGATTAPPGSDAGGQDVNAWALDYTGGTAGEASGDPIKIGYVNQDALFPEATLGIDAAVAYANAELGGIGGRPIELVTCSITVAEDGAACGAQFANDDSIVLVLTGSITVGNKELYDALNGKKAVLIGNGLTTDDFLTPAGVGYTAGAVGVIGGMAKFVIEQFHPETVAVIAVDNPSGHAVAEALFKPAFDAAGVTSNIVYVAETATAPDVASAMQAAGADTADVFVSGITLQNCISMYDGIQSLGIDPIVVTTGLCFGTPMTDHLHDLGIDGTMPDGWYFGDYGYNYYEPDYDSGMLTYVTKVQEYGHPVAGASTIEYTGFGGPMFANLLTAVKFYNEIGVDNVTFDTMNLTLRSFIGPMMIQVGPIHCGIGIFTAACGHQMGIHQYIDGGWVSVFDGLNGNPIDVTPAS